MNYKKCNGELKNILIFFYMFLAVSLHPYMYFICKESLYLFGYMILYFVLLNAPKTSSILCIT